MNGVVIPSIPLALNIDALRINGNFKILSNISLETENKKEAEVSVVNNIPLLTSTIQDRGASRDVIQNIERTDVGIKLKLTPHVNDNKEIQLKINLEIEAIIETGSPNSQLTPIIAKRTVNVTRTVPDGKTVVISGLIREDTTKVIRRIPILGSIPILGLLFRHTVDAKEKTNLMIFVTPRIITDYPKAEELAAAWKEKTGLVTTNVMVDVKQKDE